MFFSAAKKAKIAQAQTDTNMECQKCEIRRRLVQATNFAEQLKAAVLETQAISVEVVSKIQQRDAEVKS